MRPGLGTQHDQPTQPAAPATRHPLPWRNEPADGENHVTDADGLPVNDGPDAAEMFRLYGDEERAERADRPARLSKLARRRVRRRRRPV